MDKHGEGESGLRRDGSGLRVINIRRSAGRLMDASITSTLSLTHEHGRRRVLLLICSWRAGGAATLDSGEAHSTYPAQCPVFPHNTLKLARASP